MVGSFQKQLLRVETHCGHFARYSKTWVLGMKNYDRYENLWYLDLSLKKKKSDSHTQRYLDDNMGIPFSKTQAQDLSEFWTICLWIKNMRFKWKIPNEMNWSQDVDGTYLMLFIVSSGGARGFPKHRGKSCILVRFFFSFGEQ